MRFEHLEDRRLLAITVNTLVDEMDGSIVDGDISLRDAIAEVSAGETIQFAPELTSFGPAVLQLTLGQLIVDKSLSISGPGRGLLAIDAAGASQVFHINDGANTSNATVDISGLTLRHGRSEYGGAVYSLENLTLDSVLVSGSEAVRDGGGIYAAPSSGGSVTIRNSVITGNSSRWGGGGVAIELPIDGNLLVERSTFSYNQGGTQVTTDGGGVYLHTAGGGSVTISASTFVGNTANNGTGGGIAIDNRGDATIRLSNLTISGNQARLGGGIDIFGTTTTVDDIAIAHTTISGNRTVGSAGSVYGGGINLFFAEISLDHTIVAGNTDNVGGSPDIRSRESVISASFSLVGDNTGSRLNEAPVGEPDANGNLIGNPAGAGVIDAKLGPLADFGGPTKIHSLLANSPAIDAGNLTFNGAPEFDQRGAPFSRIVDGDGVGGARIDMGAFELQPVSHHSQFVVDTAMDEVNGDLSAGDLSLREAIGLANAESASLQTISFDPVLSGKTILLTHGSLQLTDSTVINGLGSNQLTIEGLGYSRIFSIDDGRPMNLLSAELRDLTIRGGVARILPNDTGDGGGIRSVESLTLERATVSGNVSGRHGGGLYLLTGENQVSSLDGNLFVDNQAATTGGGALVVASSGTVSMIKNTFQSNSAQHGGGLAAAAVSGGVMAIQQSVLTGGESSTGGGAYLAAGLNGNLTFSTASVRDNLATGESLSLRRGGGGLSISLGATGVLKVLDSTIENNEASMRGGGIEIFNQAATAQITGVTISGNRSAGDGGGVWAAALAGGTNQLGHSTVTKNVSNSDNSGSGNGGGVFAAGGITQLRHVLVAENTSFSSSPDVGLSATGTFGSGPGSFQAQFSLVGNNSGSGLNVAPIGTPDANGNLVGGAGEASINPLLGPLGFYGGSTKTHALLPGSPAIDTGNSAAVAGTGGVPLHDQRGTPFTRVFDGDGVGGSRIDIGAVETQPVSPVAYGDYNGDNQVDAADYTVWRDSLGAVDIEPFSGADGDGSGAIDVGDYVVWKSHFGESLTIGFGATTTTDANAIVASPAPRTPKSTAPIADQAIEFWSDPPEAKLNSLIVRHSTISHRAADAGLLAYVAAQSKHPPSDQEVNKLHKPVAVEGDAALSNDDKSLTPLVDLARFR